MSRLAQEKDPKVLHQAIELLQKHNRAPTAQIKELIEDLALAKGDSTFQQLRLAELERQLAKLTKQLFGPSSEQRTTDAESAGTDAPEADKGRDKGKKTARHGHT